MARLKFFLMAIWMAAPVVAAELLVPVAPQGRILGAFGTEWQAELWVYNRGSAPVVVSRAPAGGGDPPIDVPAGAAARIPPIADTWLLGGRAGVVRVSDDALEDLELQLHVRSTIGERWGTELPVVNTSSFFDERVNLLNIPASSQYRVALRIYVAFRNESSAEFAVSVYDIDDQTSLRSVRVRIESPQWLPPSFVDSSIVSKTIFDVVEGLAPMSDLGRVRIEVLPITGHRYWVFATATDNLSQYPTTFVPQQTRN